VIRPLRPDDAAELATLYRANREFLAPFEPVRPESFFTAAGQRERIGERACDGLHQFAILDGGEIAGAINLFGIVWGGLESGAIGYWVDATRNGRGLATGAVGDILRYAFHEVRLHRIEAATLVDNAPSRRVLQKNGFEQIGLARRYLRIAGDWRDHVLFQRLSDN
jgi:[ribosomal protein S5]-alanine N-acetyltransferase